MAEGEGLRWMVLEWKVSSADGTYYHGDRLSFTPELVRDAREGDLVGIIVEKVGEQLREAMPGLKVAAKEMLDGRRP